MCSSLYNFLLKQYNYFFVDQSNDYDYDYETCEQYVERNINKWMVEKYAENRYLMRIPEARIEAKRKEFEKRYQRIFSI